MASRPPWPSCICAVVGVAALLASFLMADPQKNPLAPKTAQTGNWVSRQAGGYLRGLQQEYTKWETSGCACCGGAMSQHGLCKVCVTKPECIDLVALTMAGYLVGASWPAATLDLSFCQMSPFRHSCRSHAPLAQGGGGGGGARCHP